MRKKRFAVLISGFGRGAIEIIKVARCGLIRPELALVLSSNPGSNALLVAREHGIPTAVVQREGYANDEDYEDTILAHLREHKVEYVFLAGYVRVVKKTLLDAYPGRIVNIHPSLLPSFKGLHAIDQALACGVKITGVTTHVVTDEIDCGPILGQYAVAIEDGDGFGELDRKIFNMGKLLTTRTINDYFV